MVDYRLLLISSLDIRNCWPHGQAGSQLSFTDFASNQIACCYYKSSQLSGISFPLWNGLRTRTSGGNCIRICFHPNVSRRLARRSSTFSKTAQLRGGGVLDLCCGPGRHSVEFAKRGFHVTGVDTSDYLLERARERAEEFKVQIEWVKDDMRHFRRHAAFELACILFTSFGYFEDDDENLQVARTVHESLRPGGVLITDVIGKERLARNWRDSSSSEFPDGTLLVQLPQVSRAFHLRRVGRDDS